jgi:hypothetical protein
MTLTSRASSAAVAPPASGFAQASQMPPAPSVPLPHSWPCSASESWLTLSGPGAVRMLISSGVA